MLNACNRRPGRWLAGLIGTIPLLLAGCALPHVVGLGTYYAITDVTTGRNYYSDNISREARGVVEFEDSASGARVSIPSATVREISRSEFRAGRAP